MPDGAAGGGTGSKLTNATIIVCGVASLVASVISFVYVPLISTLSETRKALLLQSEDLDANQVYHARSIWLQTFVAPLPS